MVIYYQEEEFKEVGELDHFALHFDQILHVSVAQRMKSDKKFWRTTTHEWPSFGRFTWKRISSHTSPAPPSPALDQDVNLKQLCVQAQLHAGWMQCNSVLTSRGETMSSLQREIYSVANSYTDLLFNGRTQENGESIRSIYCLHALNHVLKSSHLDKCDQMRSTYPKVLIIVSSRKAMWRVVQMLASILMADRQKVSNMKRFQMEYLDFKDPLNETYGNFSTDENLLIEVGVANQTLSLHSSHPDILIVSPMSLEQLIDKPGDTSTGKDYISSFELLIIDQPEILLMQDWNRMQNLLMKLHLSHVDMHRAQPWDGISSKSALYRQTLVFTSFVSAEVNSIFSRHCSNYAGLVCTANLEKVGSLHKVMGHIPHSFLRFQSEYPHLENDDRFNSFKKDILPRFQKPEMPKALIIVASSHDLNQLCIYMSIQEIQYVVISELSTKEEASNARCIFSSQPDVRFALYTERAYFYKLFPFEGIHHLIFYQLPIFPHIYDEMCNLIELQRMCATTTETSQTSTEMTFSAMYSQYDEHRLTAVVGFMHMIEMMSSEQNIHVFT